METPVSIVIVDDHALVRSALRELLSRQPGFTVVGEAGDPRQALHVCAEHSPRAIIVDVALGRESGIPLITELRSNHPGAAILALSMHDEQVFAQRALQAGADGYVMKHAEVPTLIDALRRVLSGRTAVSASVEDSLLRSLTGRTGDRGRTGIAKLSDRELDVLRLIGQGRKSGEIAAALKISPKTVETHRARIKVKLGAESTGDLVVMAVNWVRDGALHD